MYTPFDLLPPRSLPRLLWGWATLLFAAVSMDGGSPAARANDAPVAVRDVFLEGADGVWRLQSEGFSMVVEPGRGPVSLRLGEDEFLRQTPTLGATAFLLSDAWITAFPDITPIFNGGPSHFVGRQIAVNDGIYMVRPLVDARRATVELLGAYNGEHPARFFLFFGDDIACIRRGSPRSGEEAAQPVLGDLAPVKSALVVHRSGRAIRIDEPCLAGRATTPDGKEVWALAFDCREQEDPTLSLALELQPAPANHVFNPSFAVRNSADPARSRDHATRGVTNPIYGPDTELDFNIDFEWQGAEPFDGFAEVEIVHSLGQPHWKGRVDLKAQPAGKVRAHFEPVFTQPGISEVWGRLCDAEGRVIWSDRYRMLYDHAAYVPDVRRPADFDAFWDSTLTSLAKVPLDAKIERVAEYADHPTQEIYQLSFNTWQGQRVYAGLYVPKERTGPLPAQLVAHPGMTGFRINKGKDGVYGSKEHQKTGDFVQIAPFVRGYEPDAEGIPFNQPWWGDMSSRDDYVARTWYCTMVRAIDYLATRPELVDMERIWVSGGSQGGTLALVAAGLDPRLKACFAMCPAGCQLHEIVDSYFSFGPKRGQLPAGQTLEQLKTTLSYYDGVNFAARIRCPTVVGFNVGDTTVHAMGGLAAYQNLTGLTAAQKHLLIGYSYAHGSPDSFNETKDAIIAELSGGTEAEADAGAAKGD